MSLGNSRANASRAIWSTPPAHLQQDQQTLFKELDCRIAHTLLERDPLPDEFLVSENSEGERTLMFRGERYDLNITLFRSPTDREATALAKGPGVFVISNGAGVSTNTVDQLAPLLPVAGMIDLKRDFTKEKILAALEMVRASRPKAGAIVINIISGTALIGETVEALRLFDQASSVETPIILRFDGPPVEGYHKLLQDLEKGHPNLTLASSTAELVRATMQLYGVQSASRLSSEEVQARIAQALAIKAKWGVTADPERALVSRRRIEQVFGSRSQTRVGILGFGRTAQFQIEAMKQEGVAVAWVVTPTAPKYGEGVEVYPTVREAVGACGDVDLVVNYAPALQVLDATSDCLEGSSQMRLMLIVAEDMPYDKTVKVMELLDAHEKHFVGPNSPGVMIVEQRGGRIELFKLGNMPAHLFARAGGISVVGRSGTVIFDIASEAANAGLGTRLGWAIGGDKFTGLGMLDALVMLEQDPLTKYVVLGGEAGGIQEQLAAQLVATGVITKPVIAMVIGKSVPAGTLYGHSGAVKFTEADDPQVKERHLRQAGVVVVDNPTQVVQIIKEIERSGWNIEERRREVLWKEFVDVGRRIGQRWLEEQRPAYDLLYELVGHYRLYAAHNRDPQHICDLLVHLTTIGVDRFGALLHTTIRRDDFIKGFEKSAEYVAELVRGISETGLENFRMLVSDVFSEDSFNTALRTTPWAAGDLVNEAHELGIPEVKNIINKTMGMPLFRQTLAEKPWNTAHAFRSINNMRWWRYVRAYHRYCTHLVGDNQLAKASWLRNPWVSVKLVRGYDRIPERGLEQALEDPEAKALFFEKSTTDPEGLLNLGKRAFAVSQASGKAFAEVYPEVVRQGVPLRPTVEREIERMGHADFQLLVDTVFTREAFDRSRREHNKSTAQALRIVNDEDDSVSSGVAKMLSTFEANRSLLETPAFRLAVSRNMWMAVDLLRALSRLEAIEVHRIVDYVLSPAIFDVSVAEHQWGISQAFQKVADMGPRKFFDTHRVIEDVTRDRESFRIGFKKNPRDAVEIVQAVDRLGQEAFEQLMSNTDTREAFLARMRVGPRNAAHLLQEVVNIGASAFNEFIDEAFGRELFNEMLRVRGCPLVHTIRRVVIVGVEDFARELRVWRAEDPANELNPRNALEVGGVIKERVLEGRFSHAERRIRLSLPGQPTLETSEQGIWWLYHSYPEWGDVLFQLQCGEPLTAGEQVDLYRLVSGRKRFQMRVVSVLANFLPLRELRGKMRRGEPLIPEISRLRGVSQGPGHRFDAYHHTLEVLDQLHKRVLPMDFVSAPLRKRVSGTLDRELGHVRRRQLLVLAAALHDLGKASGDGGHIGKGVIAIQPILDRLGLSEEQKDLVTAVVKYHRPKKLRQPNEKWEDFVARGGLDLLYDEITDHGANPYPVESILHYHADILGRLGDETPDWQLRRREQVTSFTLERYAREYPEEGEAGVDEHREGRRSHRMPGAIS